MSFSPPVRLATCFFHSLVSFALHEGNCIYLSIWKQLIRRELLSSSAQLLHRYRITVPRPTPTAFKPESDGTTDRPVACQCKSTAAEQRTCGAYVLPLLNTEQYNAGRTAEQPWPASCCLPLVARGRPGGHLLDLHFALTLVLLQSSLPLRVPI